MVRRQLAIPKDLVEETGTDGLARMGGHNRASPIVLVQEVVAAFDAQHTETGFSERRNEVGAADMRARLTPQ